MQVGDRGDEVSKLQEFLARDPEVYPQGQVSGYFGALTKQAVKNFQKKHGISQAGKVGPQTLAKLNELLTMNLGATPPPPPPESPPVSFTFTKDLKMGDRGDEVKKLQEVLAKDLEVYPEGQVSGYFGALTKQAVIRFQKKYGIAQVGRVGPQTRAKLNELQGSGFGVGANANGQGVVGLQEQLRLLQEQMNALLANPQ